MFLFWIETEKWIDNEVEPSFSIIPERVKYSSTSEVTRGTEGRPGTC